MGQEAGTLYGCTETIFIISLAAVRQMMRLDTGPLRHRRLHVRADTLPTQHNASWRRRRAWHELYDLHVLTELLALAFCCAVNVGHRCWTKLTALVCVIVCDMFVTFSRFLLFGACRPNVLDKNDCVCVCVCGVCVPVCNCDMFVTC